MSAFRTVLSAGSLGALAACGLATVALAAPPKGIYGKSIVVTWNESRSQRAAGETAFKPVSLPFTLTVYVSSEGRLFRRLTSVSSTRRATGSYDRVGTGGRAENGNVGSVQFQGNAIVLTASSEGLGRRIQINLDSGLGSCTAQIISGKAPGAKVAAVRSVATGGMVEFESVSAGAATCAVQAGNAFAN